MDREEALRLARVIRQLKEIDEWSSSPQHARDVAAALSGLAANNQPVKEAIATTGALLPLVRLLRHRSSGVQEAAATAMRNLSNSSEAVKAAIVAAGAAPPLVQLLGHNSSNDTQEQAALALRNLASDSQERKTAIAAAGGVPAIVQLLGHSDSSVREAAAGALRNLANSNDRIRAAIMAAGALPAVAELLSCKRSVAAHDKAADVLCRLAAGNEAVRAAMVRAGAVPPLVRLLGHSSSNMQEQAALALRTLASGSEALKAAIVAAGTVPALVRLLEHSDSDVQREATGALRNLAADSQERKAAIAAAGAVLPLVRLLQHSQSRVQREAVGAVRNLANCSESARAAMVAAGAVPALAQLLDRRCSEELQLQAVIALHRLADGGEAVRAALVLDGAVPALVQLLERSSSSSDEFLSAAGALCTLTVGTDASQAATIIAAGAVPVLVKLLRHDSSTMQEVAAGALRCLANCNGALKADLEPDGVGSALVRLLNNSTSVGVLRQAAYALRNLSTNSPANKIALVIVGALRPLVRLLGHSDSGVQEAAAAAMRNLTNSEEVVKRLFIKEGAVAALQRLRGQGSSDMQDNIERALRNLADCDTAQQAPQLRTPAQSSTADNLAARLESELVLGGAPATPDPQRTGLSGPAGGSGGAPSPSAPAAQRPACRLIQWADLRLGNRLGSGSFGQVYLATLDETPVAAKALVPLRAGLHGYKAAASLTDRELEKFHRECSILASVSHPNVVQLLGVCESPAIIVMEFCENGSLMDVLEEARHSPEQAAELSWARRLGMALDAARGILHMHKLGMAHRDLKSPNLLVASGWRVKVADFGLSKDLEGSRRSMLSATMQHINPRWQAPEVIRGEVATMQSDAFAFGYILWELMTWDLPWEGLGPDQIDSRKVKGGHLDIPSSPESLNRLPGTQQDKVAFQRVAARYTSLMKQCWSYNPRDRPDFTTIAQQLGAIKQDI